MPDKDSDAQPPAFDSPLSAFPPPSLPALPSTPSEAGTEKASAAMQLAVVGLCVPLLSVVPLVWGQQARSAARRDGIPLNQTMKVAWILAWLETGATVLMVGVFAIAFGLVPGS